MKKEDYLNLIEKIAKDRDDLTSLDSLKSEIIKDLEVIDTLKNSVSSYEDKIQDLRDTNMKLFLKTGSAQENDEPPKEKTKDEIFNDFVNKIKGE